MAEVNQYTFSHKELVEILIREQKLHEGIWTTTFGIGVGGIQAQAPSGAAGDTVPATVISILSVGLQRVDKETPTALDAAKVNPKK